MQQPYLQILSVGGTIATGTDGFLSGATLVSLLQLPDTFNIRVEDFAQIPSSYITPQMQADLATRIRTLFAMDAPPVGVVVTHGTDSMEETAFLCDLLIDDPRPVVFTGAMRPPTEFDSDGKRNLTDAIRLALHHASHNLGVMVLLNGAFHSASSVRKNHTQSTSAFQSPDAGPLGYVDHEVRLLQRPQNHLQLAFGGIETRIGVVTLFPGSDGSVLRMHQAHGAIAIIVEAFGAGNMPPGVVAAIERLRQLGVVIVLTSRVRHGDVKLHDHLRDIGVVCARTMDCFKARILLSVTLSHTTDPEQLQSYFDSLSGIRPA